MIYPILPPEIPACAWKRAIGKGWDKPYTVRYASNLDDGPWHGMPLGGFGAGCIGRSPAGDFNHRSYIEIYRPNLQYRGFAGTFLFFSEDKNCENITDCF